MATYSSISCLENPMDRGAWQATVRRVAKSQTQLKRLSTDILRFFPQNLCSVLSTHILQQRDQYLYQWLFNRLCVPEAPSHAWFSSLPRLSWPPPTGARGFSWEPLLEKLHKLSFLERKCFLSKESNHLQAFLQCIPILSVSQGSCTSGNNRCCIYSE